MEVNRTVEVGVLKDKADVDSWTLRWKRSPKVWGYYSGVKGPPPWTWSLLFGEFFLRSSCTRCSLIFLELKSVYRRMYGFFVWKNKDFEAVFVEDEDFDEGFRGSVLNVEALQWHPLELDITEEFEREVDIIMVAAGGGLVCLALQCRSNVLRFIVMNPLT